MPKSANEKARKLAEFCVEYDLGEERLVQLAYWMSEGEELHNQLYFALKALRIYRKEDD